MANQGIGKDKKSLAQELGIKYTIVINQKAVVDAFPELQEEVRERMRKGKGEKPKRGVIPDIVDLAIFDYIREICASEHPGIKRMKVGEDVYTWIDLDHLLVSMPLLPIRDKGALSRRIRKLNRLGLIETEHGKGFSLFVRLTPLADKLVFQTSIDENQSALLSNNASVASEQSQRCSKATNSNIIYSNINSREYNNIYTRVGDQNSQLSPTDSPHPNSSESALATDKGREDGSIANSNNNGDRHLNPNAAACHELDKKWHEVIDKFMVLVNRADALTGKEKEVLLRWKEKGVTPELLDRAIDLVFEEHQEKVGDRRMRLGYLGYKVEELLRIEKERREQEGKCRMCRRGEALEFGLCKVCEAKLVRWPDEHLEMYPNGEKLKELKRKIIQARGYFQKGGQG